jgi:hypothetical protein
MRRGGDGAVLFAPKVMKEAALCEAGSMTDVVDRRRRIALRSDDVDGGVEQAHPSVCTLGRLDSRRHGALAK